MKTTLKISPLPQIKAILALILFTAFFAGCQDTEKENLKQQNAQLQGQLTETESTVNELMQSFNDVEANLALIKQKEGLIELESGSDEMSLEKKDKILNDIQDINSLMEDNRKKIADLQEQLKKSGLKVANFEKKMNVLLAQLDEKAKDIEALKSGLAAKDFEIALLTTTVDTLTGKVNEQSSHILVQDSAIRDMDKEINTYYFAEGTYAELKENGVIEKEGWTPWGGRKVEVNENLSGNQFTEIDKRETTSIPINAKKAMVISEHPEGTYEFEKDEQGLIASLEITNPDEFWKISRYLVVEVK